MPISKSNKETEKIAQQIALEVKKGGLLCLYGDLGTGKTFFTKAIAKNLNLKNSKIKSPTFTYIQKHPPNFYHIDLYRLEVIDDLLWKEIEEILVNEKNIVVIEWADKAKKKLPLKRIDIHFKYKNETSREINIKKHE